MMSWSARNFKMEKETAKDILMNTAGESVVGCVGHSAEMSCTKVCLRLLRRRESFQLARLWKKKAESGVEGWKGGRSLNIIEEDLTVTRT